MNRRDLMKSAIGAIGSAIGIAVTGGLVSGGDSLIIYERINRRDKFADLSSEYVFDNDGGSASCTQNKTSIYLMGENAECLARMVNISVSNIDGVDDFSVEGTILTGMISKNISKNIKIGKQIRMNTTAYGQLLDWWYSQKEVEEPEEFKSFAGVEIVIDDRIQNNQETVI